MREPGPAPAQAGLGCFGGDANHRTHFQHSSPKGGKEEDAFSYQFLILFNPLGVLFVSIFSSQKGCTGSKWHIAMEKGGGWEYGFSLSFGDDRRM